MPSTSALKVPHKLRFLSKKGKHTKDAEDTLTEESLLNGIKLFKRNGEIEKVCMQDILMSDFGVAKGFEPNRFKKFEFSDSLEPQQFATWQERRDTMMETYRNTDQITWHANVTLRPGTTLDEIVDFLFQVQGDLHVFTIAFTGAHLEDCWLPAIADELCGLVDQADLTLTKEVVVHVHCGWGEDDSWLELLDDCVSRLTAMTRSSSKHSNKSSKPAIVSGEPPVMRCQASLAA